MSSRVLGRSDPVRVAIVDDSGLIYSDDYRLGWLSGFKGIGCTVEVFDISQLRRVGMTRSPYSAGSARGYPKMVAKNIVKWRPDLVFAHHGRAASHQGFLSVMHAHGARTAVYLCDEPYEVGETAAYSPLFKFAFTMDPCTVGAHRAARAGKPGVFYLPPGVDTDHFKPKPYEKRDITAFFLGNATLIPRAQWLKPVERLVDGADIRYWKSTVKGGPGWISVQDHPLWFQRVMVGLNVYRHPGITKECWKRRVNGRPRAKPIPRGMALWPTMPAHDGTGFWNDPNLPASHVNPRFMEMAACGTLVVSDDSRSEHRRMFPMAPVAEDPEHFLELVNYYLKNLDEAEEIGRACSYLISKRHSYRHRAAEVLIRAGLKASDAADLRSSLGEPEDWLSPQDWSERGESLSSGRTGPSERWSPAFGMSSIQTSGSPSEASSLDVQNPWLA